MKIKNPKGKVFILLVILIFTVVLYIMPFSCPVLSITHIPCPGCGMTRAILSALQFKFGEAFSYHFMFWSLPVLGVFFIFDGRLFKRNWVNIMLLAFIGVGFVVNWIFHLKAL